MSPPRPTSRAKRPPPTPSLVEWKEGVHLVGTHLVCDALRTREACFVSHAGMPRVRRHRQTIATGLTLALLAARDEGAARGGLAVTYGRPFVLGAMRLELFPSGHCVGGAGLVATVGDARVVYAGTAGAGGVGASLLAEPGETRAGDALVIDCALAHPRFRFPAADDVQRELIDWIAATLGAGMTPILLCDPLARGLDLVKLLGARCLLRLARPLHDLARHAKANGVDLPSAHRLDGAPSATDVVLWPLAARDAKAITRVRRARFALVDALALDPVATGALRVDAAFPWSSRAGWDDLLAWVRASGARSVYALDSSGDELARALAPDGVTVRPLGPPRQLGLFPA